MLMMKSDKLSTAFYVAPEGMLRNVTVSWIKYQLKLLNRWASLELKIIYDDEEKLCNINFFKDLSSDTKCKCVES